MEGIELVSALALLLGADLGCARKRQVEGGLNLWPACDLAADVADEAAKPRSRQAQLCSMALELLAWASRPAIIAACLAMRRYDCRSLTPRARAKRLSPLIAAWTSLASVGKVMAFGRTVVSTVTRLRSPVRSAPVSSPPRAFGEQEFQLAAEPLSPMAEVGTLVREFVLEKLKPGELLEIRIVDPALADLLIRQAVNVLEQQQPNHETAPDPADLRCRAARSRDRSSPSRSSHQAAPARASD